MPTEILQQLGLSPNEAKIYEALLDLKEAGVGKISSKTEVHRRNVYDTLKRLIEKGLVSPVLSRGENLYSPVDPDKLLGLVKKEEESLEKVLPGLRAKYRQREKTQEAYIYRGLEGMKNYMRDILRQGKDTYTIGAQLCWLDPRIRSFSEQVIKKMRVKGMKFHDILDEGVKEKGAEDLKQFCDSSRTLPKEYCTNSAVDIFGDYVVSFSGVSFEKIDDDVTMFVLRDKRLAESYRTWFQFMFDHCPKAIKPQKAEKQKVTMHEGKAAFREAHFEAVEQMKDNGALYVLIASGEKWYGSMGSAAMKKFDGIRIKKNITEKVVALESQQEWPRKRPLIEMKFLPEEFENMSDTVVYDDITLITFHGDPVFAVMIKNKQVAESYKKYFDILWKMAKK